MIASKAEIIEHALLVAGLSFAEEGESYIYQHSSNNPTGPFYVVGGAFVGNLLSANGDLVGSLPGDPGPSPFDWLLAA